MHEKREGGERGRRQSGLHAGNTALVSKTVVADIHVVRKRLHTQHWVNLRVLTEERQLLCVIVSCDVVYVYLISLMR